VVQAIEYKKIEFSGEPAVVPAQGYKALYYSSTLS
jgi:hypothetical protein